jgi:transposase
MEHHAGIDVSLESWSVCLVDAAGRVVREAKTASEPAALVGWLARIGDWSAVAMALCGDAGRWASGRSAGDAARMRCLQGTADGAHSCEALG